MINEVEDLKGRVLKLEKQKTQEILALVEILSNATFFGQIKNKRCPYSKNGQCGFFVLQNQEEPHIPIVEYCKIKGCEAKFPHCHIVTSNLTCTFCSIYGEREE